MYKILPHIRNKSFIVGKFPNIQSTCTNTDSDQLSIAHTNMSVRGSNPRLWRNSPLVSRYAKGVVNLKLVKSLKLP